MNLRPARLSFNLIVFAMLAILIGCGQRERDFQNACNAAGGNKLEIQNVISYFKAKGDKQKLDAAYFLIKNLPYQYHLEGAGVSSFDTLFGQLAAVKEDRKEYMEQIWDSLKALPGAGLDLDRHYVTDAASVKAACLINHIESAFVAWKKPWARSLTFDEFCEFILPYKLVNERPDSWNEEIQARYSWLDDSMSAGKDSYDACLLINDKLKSNFHIRSFPALWDVNFHGLDLIGSGKCYHATQYTAYVMRALGVPVVMDFTPVWGNMNGGHDWNALIYNGKPIPFVGSESDPGKTKIDLAFQRKRAKVFRRQYACQPNSLAIVSRQYDVDIPELFKNERLSDVTGQYIPVSNVSVRLTDKEPEEPFVYLCVFNRQAWWPVSWAKTGGESIEFPAMGREIMYLPMYFDSGELKGASYPVYLTKDGTVEVLQPLTNKLQHVVIRKKSAEGPSVSKGKQYELFYWKDKWRSLGKQTATADSLVYANVPSSALLWVRSPDKATKERIFTVSNHEPLWR